MGRFISGLLLTACAWLIACGGGGGPGQLGERCAVGDDCDSGFCWLSSCADPAADVDYDGLGSLYEFEHSLDPLNPDTDGDGLPDGFEVGGDLDAPADFDGDGLIDARESILTDTDGDCLPDQYDPASAVEPAKSAEMVPVLCSDMGVCRDAADVIVAVCTDGTVSCNYESVPGWNQDEWVCDGLDNNCNGYVDEGFYYDGIPVGLPCLGVGECGPGTVECGSGGFGTRCSTNPDGSESGAVAEVCDGLDNDCDGASDNGLEWNGIALGGRCDGTGECGIGTVECLPDHSAGCSTLLGGSREQVVEEYCDGADNDCDGQTDESFSGDPAAICSPKGVCSRYANKVALSCEGGVLICDYSGVPGYSGDTELKCDGQDDDCDGQVDEEPNFAVFQPGSGIRLPGQSCGAGACAGGTVTCSADGLSAVCSTAVFASAEICNDADDDCDGYQDDGYFKSWESPLTTFSDLEPQSRVSSMLTVVEYSVEDPAGPDEPPAGVYVCGGARSGTAAVLSSFTGACWRYDTVTRRFMVLPAAPVLESGALVHDRNGGRVLLAGNRYGTGQAGLWAMARPEDGWLPVVQSFPAGRIISVGIEPAERILQVLLQTATGITVMSVDLDDSSTRQADVAMTVRPGSFAAFDPSGGFYIIQGCDDVADSVLGHVAADGDFIIESVAVDSFCASYGAAVMTQTNRIVVMDGINRDGLIGGTVELTLFAGVWQRSAITAAGELGAMVRPGLAAFGDSVYAFSGMHADGRGLRRMAKLDRALGSWTVVSVVSGPSPRAGGVAFVSHDTASAYFIGGYSDEPGGQVAVSDAWRFDLIGQTALQVMTTGDPGVVIDSAVAVDGENQVAYLFGGLDGPPGGDSMATSRFVRFHLDNGRFEVLASGDQSPPARYGHTLVWTGDMLIMYGGLNNDGFLGDVWTWTQAGGWLHAGDGGLRFGHSAFWDVRRQRMLVVGGRPGADLIAWNPADGGWEVLASNSMFDSYEGLAWYDDESDSLLWLPGSSSSGMVESFEGDLVIESEISGIESDILDGFAVYDPFGRRALLMGGVDPQTGVVAAGRQISQACR